LIKTINNDTIKEILYHANLANGLKVYVMPKKGYVKNTPYMQQDMDLLIIGSG
jgi:hypothetical protein